MKASQFIQQDPLWPRGPAKKDRRTALPVFQRPTPDVPDYLTRYAEEQRREPAYAERVAANAFLRASRRGRWPAKWPIRTQYPLPPYIVDFICLPSRLIIEIDGFSHHSALQQQRDEERTEYFEQAGYRVIRFSNESVINDPDWFITCVKTALRESSPSRVRKSTR